jgi:hypothetical protein
LKILLLLGYNWTREKTEADGKQEHAATRK